LEKVINPLSKSLKTGLRAFIKMDFWPFPGYSHQNAAPPRVEIVTKVWRPKEQGGELAIMSRMFGHSADNLALFDLDPLVTFAEHLIDDCNGERPNA
jgi:hypothetical protein